jgi:hypothetical protein
MMESRRRFGAFVAFENAGMAGEVNAQGMVRNVQRVFHAPKWLLSLKPESLELPKASALRWREGAVRAGAVLVCGYAGARIGGKAGAWWVEGGVVGVAIGEFLAELLIPMFARKERDEKPKKAPSVDQRAVDRVADARVVASPARPASAPAAPVIPMPSRREGRGARDVS